MKHLLSLLLVLCSVTTAHPQACKLIAGRINAFTRVPPPSLFADRVELGSSPTSDIRVQFDTSFTNWEAQRCFERAAQIWSYLLVYPGGRINIKAVRARLDSHVLASTHPESPNILYRDHVYPRPLGEMLGGTPNDPDSADIIVTVNSQLDGAWYYGTDGYTPAGKFDFLTVVLHEIAHGLAYWESFGMDSGGVGRRSPIPFAYDSMCVVGTRYPNNDRLTSPNYPDGSIALGQQLTSNNIYRGGLRTWQQRDRNTNIPAKLYAPAQFKPGSSMSHLDESTYGPGTPNSLMSPQQDSAEAIHSPGQLGLAILEDMGWWVNRLVTFIKPLAGTSVVRGDSLELEWSDNRGGVLDLALLRRSFTGEYTFYSQLSSQILSEQRSLNRRKILIPSTVDTGWYKLKVFEGVLGFALTFAFQVTATAEVERVVIFPPGGTYGGPQNLTMSCATQGAVIRYDTTGGEPTENSPSYPAGGIDVFTTRTVKAKAFKPPLAPSPTEVQHYTILPGAGVTWGPRPPNLIKDVVRYYLGGQPYYTPSGSTYPNVGTGYFISGGTQQVARGFLQWWDLPADIIPDSITSATLEIGAYQWGAFNATVSLFRTTGNIADDPALWNAIEQSGTLLGSGISMANGYFTRTYPRGSTFVNALKAGLNLDRSFQIAVRSDDESSSDKWMQIGNARLTITYNKPVVRIAQVDSSGVAFGRWAKWETNRWVYYPDTSIALPPSTTTFSLRADTNLKPATTQKYQSWSKNNRDIFVPNHADVPVDPTTLSVLAQFRPSYAATLQGQLIEGGAIGGTIDFKDPWLIDDADSKGPKNRGVNAIWHYNIPSPFKPDTSAWYKGVFLNQGGPDPNNLTPPYYSVGAPLTQTIGGIESYFVKWTGDTNQVAYRSPDKDTTALVFKTANATAVAKYKANMRTSNASALATNGQRKVLNAGGSAYLTYESGGGIWLQSSANNGSSWTINNNTQPLNWMEAKSPSISALAKPVIAFQESDPTDANYSKIMIVSYSDDPAAGTLTKRVDSIRVYNPGQGDLYPNIRLAGSWLVLLWTKSGTLNFKFGIATFLNGGHISIQWHTAYPYPQNWPLITEPAIAYSFESNVNYFHVVYQGQSPSGERGIFYQKMRITCSGGTCSLDPVAPAQNISAGNGAWSNSKPSIICIGTTPYVSWTADYCNWGYYAFAQMVTLTQPGVFQSYAYPVNATYLSTLHGSDGVATDYVLSWSEGPPGSTLTGRYLIGSERVVRTLTDGSGNPFAVRDGIQLMEGFPHAPAFGLAVYDQARPALLNVSAPMASGGGGGDDEVMALQSVASSDGAELFFGMKDITLDNVPIAFEALPESIHVHGGMNPERYLISKAFRPSSTSTLRLTMLYGCSDSLRVARLLSTGRRVSFVPMIVDAQSHQLLASLNPVVFQAGTHPG